jgi:hypothetical protein
VSEHPGPFGFDRADVEGLELAFRGEIWHWRGPAPHHFVSVPPEDAATLQSVASHVTYGWGMIPVTVRLGRRTWDTSLFPRDGTFIVPLKASIRRLEGLEPGDTVDLRLTIRTGPARRDRGSATVASGR